MKGLTDWDIATTKNKRILSAERKNTLNNTLLTVKNIKDTNNTYKKNISEEDVSKIDCSTHA